MVPGEILEVVERLNPLGFIENMYARKLSYKLETRKLKNEMESMRSQADLLKRKMGLEYDIRLEQIKQRRAEMELLFKQEENKLAQLTITREQVLRMAENAQNSALAEGISLEEREFFASMSYEYIRQVHAFGESSRQSLKNLLGAVERNESLLLTEGKQ